MKQKWIDWIARRGGAVDLTTTGGELPPGLREVWQPSEFELVPGPGSFARIVGTSDVELILRAALIPPPPEWNGAVERRIDTASGVVEHRKFFLRPGYFAKRKGSRMIRESALLYKEAGLSEIQTTAFSIGKYVWARAGFEFASEVVAENVNRVVSNCAIELGLTEEALPFFEYPWEFASLDLGEDGEQVSVSAARIQALLENRPFAAPSPTPMSLGTRIPASKALLIYADYLEWEGVLNLGDESPGLERLLSYTEGV